MANKKNDILAAAKHEFIQNGFAGARTIAIAKEAGVTHAMLHYYFKTKQQLFLEVVTEKIEAFRQSVLMEIRPDDDTDVKDQVVELVGRHFDYLVANPLLPRFLVTNMANQELVASVLKPMSPSLMDNLQEFAALLQRGGIDIEPLALVQDIVALNVSAFLMLPVVEQTGADTQAYLSQRRLENMTLIRARISCEI